jgi:hypothetical protein
MTYVKVKNNENLVRDTNTNAILNTDIAEYTSYIQNYKQAKKLTNNEIEIQKINNEINNLKDNLSEIKDILHTIITEIKK